MQGKLLLLLLSAFILRIFLAPFGTLENDFYTFFSWSRRLAQDGFLNFYREWSDYLPGYLYILWFLGKVNQNFPNLSIFLLYKLPAIAADIGTGFLIYRGVLLLKGKNKLGLWACAGYLFNPAIIANSALWGQVDGLVAFASLATISFARSNPLWSSIFLALGTLVKPQVAFVAPIVCFIWFKNMGVKSLIYTSIGLLIFLSAFTPFTISNNLVAFAFERLAFVANQYPYTSVNAFNLWGLYHGFWVGDEGFASLGALLYVFVLILVLWKLFFAKKPNLFLAGAVLFLASFMFLTRMHERHLLPTFAPLAVAAALNPFLWIFYAILSLTYVINLYAAGWRPIPNFDFAPPQEFTEFLILLNLVAFVSITAVLLRPKLHGFFKNHGGKIKEETPPKKIKTWLLSILLFAFVSRIVGLWHPANFYFDEVYHAFTAREMLRGNPASWEWWNDPPEGFAYEWTHPPLAKLFMAFGMLLFGQTSLGWRLPGAIFGTAVVFLVYLLGKKLFGARAGLLAAAIVSLDGLLLVMSRVGMNDIYFLFFSLLTILFFLERRLVFAAISLGLALSTKWAAFWIGPVLLLVMFFFKIKPRWAIFWFPLLVPVIYLLSYTPFFLSGHTIDQFIELQKQMWWYHTGLTATHPYQSSWWSWPLMLRPIWLFTDSKDNLVANIYALGNPFVFWGGLVAMGFMGVMAVARRQKELLFILVSWGLLFLPWAFSPRIMFFYHYLPALPFLALSIGWFLSRQRPQVRFTFFVLLFAFYLFFLPHWTGIYIPRWLDNLYYWLPSWR